MATKSNVRKALDSLIDEVDNWKPIGWYPLAHLAQSGQGVSTFRRKILGWESEQSGIYFFRCKNLSDFKKATGITPRKRLFYVGRSGKIVSRINGHISSPSHYSASLVYLMTTMSRHKHLNNRAANMNVEGFRNRFRAIQKFLRHECEMSYYLCPNNEKQALLEILFSLKFRTQFNEWKTH